MPSDKRERKRQNHQARREAMLAAQRRAELRRRIIAAVVASALFAGVVFAIVATSGDKAKAKKVTTSATTVAPRPTSTSAGKGAEPTCPAADGSAPTTKQFTKPFPMCIDPSKTYTATIETDAGTMTAVLAAKKAPKTVNNFVSLARYHYFDGIVFHRVVPGFVIQGGDPEGTGRGGPGYTFADELPKNGEYEIGSLAMANSGPDTNGSQFFIIVGKNGASLPPNYSLFGKVTAGMDVATKIEADGAQDPNPPKVLHKMLKVTIKES